MWSSTRLPAPSAFPPPRRNSPQEQLQQLRAGDRPYQRLDDEILPVLTAQQLRLDAGAIAAAEAERRDRRLEHEIAQLDVVVEQSNAALFEATMPQTPTLFEPGQQSTLGHLSISNYHPSWRYLPKEPRSPPINTSPPP